jgi:hypothetical protein
MGYLGLLTPRPPYPCCAETYARQAASLPATLPSTGRRDHRADTSRGAVSLGATCLYTVLTSLSSSAQGVAVHPVHAPARRHANIIVSASEYSVVLEFSLRMGVA